MVKYDEKKIRAGTRPPLIPTTGCLFCSKYFRHYSTKAAISQGYCTSLYLSCTPRIPFHSFAHAEGILFCKPICPKVNHCFCKVWDGSVPELAIHLFALGPPQGTEQKCALSSAPAPDQMKCPWISICSSSVVHFSTWSHSYNFLFLLWGVQTNLALKHCPNY